MTGDAASSPAQTTTSVNTTPAARPVLHPNPSSSSTVGSSRSYALSTPATSVGLDELRLDLSRMGQSASIDSMISNHPTLANLPPTVGPYLAQLLAELEANPAQFKTYTNSAQSSPVSGTGVATGCVSASGENDFIFASLNRIACRLEGTSPAEAVEPRLDSTDHKLTQLAKEYEDKLAAQQLRHQQELQKSQIHHDDEVR